jgi:hypothetical protein
MTCSENLCATTRLKQSALSKDRIPQREVSILMLLYGRINT